MLTRDRKVFVLFGGVAALVVGGAVAASVVGPGFWPFAVSRGCEIDGGGTALAPRSEHVATRIEQGKWKAVRSLTYELDAPQRLGLAACTDTGSVKVTAARRQGVLVEAEVHGWGLTEQAAREAAASLQPAVSSDGAMLWAYHPPGRWRDVAMALRVEVPAALTLEADLSADTGSVTVDGPRLARLAADTDTGGIKLSPSWAEGTLSASADTGSVEARFPALGAASLNFATDTGGIKVNVPADERHGYDITARADTGSITLELPGLRETSHGRDAEQARTEGYESRAVQVTMSLRTDTGSIRVGAA